MKLERARFDSSHEPMTPNGRVGLLPVMKPSAKMPLGDIALEVVGAPCSVAPGRPASCR
ncbi:hypothetical protein SCOCK_20155 [Actinacidiphila cocklensis]|uniref:Uncharacterized protein n=1 Tax=Actinacidiphila cocklensis TaxID=887465 RepID=A0A9W4DND2_9ACTN|nr:hypothetical protein SCOCK_20155 [Actinacidiphila cocklensis]